MLALYTGAELNGKVIPKYQWKRYKRVGTLQYTRISSII